MPLSETIVTDTLVDMKALHTKASGALNTSAGGASTVSGEAAIREVESVLKDVIAFSDTIARSASLFRIRNLVDREQQIPLSLEFVRNTSELLGKYCEVLAMEVPSSVEPRASTVMQVLSRRSAVVQTTPTFEGIVPPTPPVVNGLVVPQALSLLLSLSTSKNSTRGVQKVICGAVEYLAEMFEIGYYDLPCGSGPDVIPIDNTNASTVATRAAISLRHEGNVTLLFHWFVAVACLTQSRHKTRSIRLARLCEIYASIPPDDSEDRKGVVDVIKSAALLPIHTPVVSCTMYRIALRFVAFSLCSLSRCAYLVESSGRFFSELGRIGSILPQLALQGSPALFAIASSLLNVLSSDGGRMFDADPSIGEFLTVVFRERHQLSTRSSGDDTTSYSWHSHGARHWFGDLVMRGNISTGHKLDGATAVKCRELTNYVVGSWDTAPQDAGRMSASAALAEVFAVSIARSISAKVSVQLLDTGISHLLRLMALHYTAQLQAFMGQVAKGAAVQMDIPRSLLSHWRSSISCLILVISNGASHRMASALLLLVQGNLLVTSVNSSGEGGVNTAHQRLSRTERQLLSGLQKQTEGIRSYQDESLLAKLLGLLSTMSSLDAPDPTILYNTLLLVSEAIEAAWNQSPRDLAPHIIELNLLTVVHTAAAKLLSLAPLQVVDDTFAKELQLWLGITLQLCHVTADIVELHEGIRDALLTDANMTLSCIASTIGTAWILTAMPLDAFIDATNKEHSVDIPSQQQSRDKVESCFRRIAAFAALRPIFARAVLTQFDHHDSVCRSRLLEHGDQMESALFWQLNATSVSIGEFRAVIAKSEKENPDTDAATSDEQDYGKLGEELHGLFLKSFVARSAAQFYDWPRLDKSSLKAGDWLCRADVAEAWESSVRTKIAEGRCIELLEATSTLLENDGLHRVSRLTSNYVVVYPLRRMMVNVLWFAVIDPTVALWRTGTTLNDNLRHALEYGMRDTFKVIDDHAKSLYLASLVDAVCAPTLPTSDAPLASSIAAQLDNLFPLVVTLEVAPDAVARVVDVAIHLLKLEPANVAYQGHLCNMLRHALTLWDTRANDQEGDADNAVSEWLLQTDMVTTRIRQLQGLYDGAWGQVPLNITVEVYAHMRLLTQLAYGLQHDRGDDGRPSAKKKPPPKGTKGKKLWEDVTSRVRTVLAEMVAMFLVSVPTMPLACVSDALPVLEHLTLDVTTSLSEGDVAAFWTRVVREGILNRPVPPPDAPGAEHVGSAWLFRVLVMVTTGASNEADPVVRSNKGRSGNLSMLAFMMADIVATHTTTLSAEYRTATPSSDASSTHSAPLSCADSLMTIVWSALQPEQLDDAPTDQGFYSLGQTHVSKKQCRKSLHIFLKDKTLEQSVVLPLLARVANPSLSSDVFYERVFSAVLEAMRIAAFASEQLSEAELTLWRPTLIRLQAKGCASLEQLCYLNQEFFCRFSSLVHENPNVRVFLSSPMLSNFEVNSRDLFMIDPVEGTSYARLLHVVSSQMLSLYSERATLMQRRVVAEAVFESVAQEVSLLPKGAQRSIFFVGLPEGAAPVEGVTSSTAFVDASVFLTELAARRGAEDEVDFNDIKKSLDVSDVVGFVVFDEHGAAPVPVKGKKSAPSSTKGKATPNTKEKRTSIAAAAANKGKKAPKPQSPPAAPEASDEAINIEPPSGCSKVYCYLLHTPGMVAQNEVDRAILTFLAYATQMYNYTETFGFHVLQVAAAPATDATEPVLGGPTFDRFVEICRASDQTGLQMESVKACCDQGLTVPLVNAVLRHCVSSRERGGGGKPAGSVVDDVEQLLSGCFGSIAYFHQRSLALALKSRDSELNRNFTTVERHLFALRKTVTRPHSRVTENAWSLMLFLHACRVSPLSHLATCKPKFQLLRHDYLRMDRYGAADDRDSFDDRTQFSDLTALSGNHSTTRSESEGTQDSDDEDEQEHSAGSPEQIFQYESEDEGYEMLNGDFDEDESGEDGDGDGSDDDGPVRSYKRRNEFERLARRADSCAELANNVVSFVQSMVSGSPAAPHLSRITLPPGTRLQEELRCIVPLGKNCRWLRYFDTTTAAGRVFLTSADLTPWLVLNGSPPRNAMYEALCAMLCGVTPYFSLRGKVANKLLLSIVGQACVFDDCLMVAVSQLVALATAIPRLRLIALRVIYTVTTERRTLGRVAPAATVSAFLPHDINKVQFFQTLLAFLALPTMSVLSQRMVTYVLSSTYSEDDSPDDDLDWDASEPGDGGNLEGNPDAHEEGVEGDSDEGAATNESEEWHEPSKIELAIGPTHTHNGPSLRPQYKLPTDRSVGKQNVRHPHELGFVNILEVQSYLSGTFQCDVCHQDGGVYSFHCEECEYDECPRCVFAAAVQRPLTNDDFDNGGGPYYEPTDDFEIQERERASTNVFAHDQFLRLCHAMPLSMTATQKPFEILLNMLQEANCVDGCTDFLVDAISSFFRAAVFPWHHPTQKMQPPFLPEVSRSAISDVLVPFVCEHGAAFLDRRLQYIDQARKLLAAIETHSGSTIPGDSWLIEKVGEAVHAMDCVHAEALRGAQVLILVPLCADMCPNQQVLNILDGLVQRGWDVLTGHYDLLTKLLKTLSGDDNAPQELYGTVTMSQGNVNLLTTMGKYYRALTWRNTYVARMLNKMPHQRLHEVPLNVLTSTAGPTELRAQTSMLMQHSESELFGLEDVSTPVSSGGKDAGVAFHSSEGTTSKKSELLLEVLARRRGATAAASKPTTSHGRPTTATAAAAAAAKEVKAEAEDPWNEERSEEIGSIVGFAASYRLALNFLIASRNDPSTTLDSGVDFLLNTPKILEFSIRLAAYRAKMEFLHDSADEECDLTVTREGLLVTTFREMTAMAGDLMTAAKKADRVNALATKIGVVFDEEDAMDAGGVKREWITLVFQRIIQLIDQAATTEQTAKDLSLSTTATPTTTSPLAQAPPAVAPKLPISDFLDEWFPPILVRSGDVSGGAFELSPIAEPTEEMINITRVLGMLVGVAMSYDVPIELHLTRSMYSHMIGRQPNLRDLEATDPDLYKNLKYILSITSEEDMEALCIAFTAPCARAAPTTPGTEAGGSTTINGEVALIPQGADIPVTMKNRSDYIRRRAEYRMSQQSRGLMVPFLDGFHFTMPIGFLQCFTAEDLELVSCGVSSVDVEDLRAHATYEGFQLSSNQVRWFWECCATMSQQDLVKLIQFATASTRPPAGGFAALNPPLMLVRCPASENLPVAHTCMNRIDLPEYESAAVLREKLKQALAFGNVGFGLV